MPGFTDDGLTQYAYNTHLRWLESQLFNTLGGRDASPYQRMAREDVRRALRRLGYIDPLEPRPAGRLGFAGVSDSLRGEIADRSSKATARLLVSNTSESAALTIPAGAVFQDQDPYGDEESQLTLDSARGAYRWEALAELTLAAGASAQLDVRALVPGAPHNVCAGSEVNEELGVMYAAARSAAWAQTLSASWGQLLTAGVDHQLARLCSFRALAYAFGDLAQVKDDPCDYKRQLYERRYRDELDLVTASGVEITQDGNEETSSAEDALRYGSMTLYRS